MSDNPKVAVIDLAYLLAHYGDDLETLFELLRETRDFVRGESSGLSQSVESADWKNVCRIAHRLRGSLGLMAMNEAAHAAAAFEDAVVARHLEQAPSLGRDLLQAFRRLEKTLSSLPSTESYTMSPDGASP